MRWFLVLAMVLPLGCSRRPSLTLDAGTPDIPPDQWIPPDQITPPDHAPDAPLPPPGCTALQGFAKAAAITSLRAKKALLSTKLDRAVLIDASGAAHAVPLPSGGVTSLGPARALAWLDPAETTLLVERDGGTPGSSYDLWTVPVDGAPGKLLAQGVCDHRAAPDGSRVLVLRSCQSYSGTLELVDVTSGTTAWIEQGVSTSSLELSKDGAWAVFVSGASDTGNCAYRRGTAQTVDSAGQTHLIETGALEYSVGLAATAAGATVLYRTLASCDEAGVQLWSKAADGAGGATLLTQGLDYAYPFFPRPRYAVSADGARLLGAKTDPAGAQFQLFAVPLDGSGEKLLAADLFPYMMISMAFQPWAFSRSGDQVVYTSTGSPYPAMGLSSVSSATGKVSPLAAQIQPAAYVMSSTADEVAYIEPPDASGMTKVWLARLQNGASQVRFESPHSVSRPGFVPDGRGLLLTATDAAGSTTLYYTAASGTQLVAGLGGWSASQMNGYVTDPGGCAALFDSDRDGGGTHLVLIPR